MTTHAKTAVLLLNLGGPDSLAAVKPFLFNLFSDPEIFKLPLSFIFQKPLAWWIATSRAEESRGNYAKIGGRSPIVQYTEAQAEALRQRLIADGVGDFPMYIAMRYWDPMTDAAIEKMQADGIEQIIVLPMYPHFSLTTTGSSLNELARVIRDRNIHWPVRVIEPWSDRPDYHAAVAETIQEGLDTHEWSCPKNEVRILFSAHSLPLRHVKRTGDPYPDQIHACVKAIAETHFPGQVWDLGYQSRVGTMPWLGPDVDGVLHYYAGKNIDNVLLVPISFVSEHVETLFEIDQLYLPLGKELGLKHCHRAPALNTRASFVEVLARLVAGQWEKAIATEAPPPLFEELVAEARTAAP